MTFNILSRLQPASGVYVHFFDARTPPNFELCDALANSYAAAGADASVPAQEHENVHRPSARGFLGSGLYSFAYETRDSEALRRKLQLCPVPQERCGAVYVVPHTGAQLVLLDQLGSDESDEFISLAREFLDFCVYYHDDASAASERLSQRIRTFGLNVSASYLECFALTVWGGMPLYRGRFRMQPMSLLLMMHGIDGVAGSNAGHDGGGNLYGTVFFRWRATQALYSERPLPEVYRASAWQQHMSNDDERLKSAQEHCASETASNEAQPSEAQPTRPAETRRGLLKPPSKPLQPRSEARVLRSEARVTGAPENHQHVAALQKQVQNTKADLEFERFMAKIDPSSAKPDVVNKLAVQLAAEKRALKAEQRQKRVRFW